MAALRLVVDDAGIIRDVAVSIGACSEVAKRMDKLEDALRDTALATASARVTPDLFIGLSPIDDVRATAAYRLQASCEITRRLLCEQQSNFAKGVAA